MRHRFVLPLFAAIFIAGCTSAPESSRNSAADPAIAAEVRAIRAIDNHAHPVRVVSPGEKPDRDFDALPVDNMEPQTDPVNLRPNAPAMLEAWNALYGLQLPDLNKDHLAQAQAAKAKMIAARGNAYPEWILDQLGEDVMLANRVEMGPGIQPPRFRWVPYADALIFPLDNSRLAARNPDRKSFFALEDVLRARYLKQIGLDRPPATLAEYLARVVTPILEAQHQGGAVAEKFEAAYLRSLEFDRVDRAEAERVYARFIGREAPDDKDYNPLQDFLFRYIAGECGRLGMAVHIHTMAGAGGYFEVAGANPLLLESVLNDPGLRKTSFVMLHGGWPFIREIAALLTKPNAYLDFSQQDLMLPAPAMAANLREWLEIAPEKVLFATDAYPYIPEMGWEESGWMAARTARDALALALSGMVRDGEITRSRASELARMVLRDNARALYRF